MDGLFKRTKVSQRSLRRPETALDAHKRCLGKLGDLTKVKENHPSSHSQSAPLTLADILLGNERRGYVVQVTVHGPVQVCNSQKEKALTSKLEVASINAAAWVFAVYKINLVCG